MLFVLMPLLTRTTTKSFSVWVCGKSGKTMDVRNDLHTLNEVKQAAIELSIKFDLNDNTTNKIRYKSIWA